jgi:hypothetical protein
MVSTVSRSSQPAAIAPAFSPLVLESNAGSVVLHNLTWDVLERLDEALAETGARFIYLDGSLAMMAPPSEGYELVNGSEL